ncbi:MAG: cytochrome c oxidase assembly protein [Methylobacteriaceae bacterium]|nr:cytochrome c oxidase assembly protein [Methylobacteriaceae bacterium]
MRALGLLLGLAAGLLGAAPAVAHPGEWHLDSGWTIDPWVVAPLGLSLLVYAAGAARLARRAELGRAALARRSLLYAGGWGCLTVALTSPLHEAGEQLFTAHMVEHELVMAVAAPLLALSRPLGPALWALPADVRLRVLGFGRAAVGPLWRGATEPWVATTLHGATIWFWHVPALFDRTVGNVPVHRAQHISFLLTALLFWWALSRRAGRGVAAGHLALTMLHTGLLGALLALAPRVLYGAQTICAPQWGLTPLEDQQLAGLVMWVPAGTIYAGAALACLALWIRRSEPMLPGGTRALRAG